MNEVPFKVKVAGRRRPEDSPEAAYRRAVVLQRSADRMNPFPKPRGFVFKAKTWEDYAAWRKAQENPRLW